MTSGLIDSRSLMLDALSFYEEKIGEARVDPRSRAAAMSEAAGYARCVCRMLTESDPAFGLRVTFVWEPAVDGDWWVQAAEQQDDEFETATAAALTRIGQVRDVVIDDLSAND